MWESAALTGGSGSTWADSSYPSTGENGCNKIPPSLIQEVSKCKPQGHIKSARKFALGFATACNSLGFVVLVSGLGRGWAWGAGEQAHQGLSGRRGRMDAFQGLGHVESMQDLLPPGLPASSQSLCPLHKPLLQPVESPGGHPAHSAPSVMATGFSPEPWALGHLHFSLCSGAQCHPHIPNSSQERGLTPVPGAWGCPASC